MKSNVILIVIALVVGFGAGFALRPILSPPAVPATIAATTPAAASGGGEARGAQYFTAHVDEARRVVAGCRAGTTRGAECDNAGQAIEEVEGKARMKAFLGH